MGIPIDAVSYTHLDVYKRQVLCGVQRTKPITRQSIWLCVYRTVRAGTNNVAGADFIFYTFGINPFEGKLNSFIVNATL